MCCRVANCCSVFLFCKILDTRHTVCSIWAACCHTGCLAGHSTSKLSSWDLAAVMIDVALLRSPVCRGPATWSGRGTHPQWLAIWSKSWARDQRFLTDVVTPPRSFLTALAAIACGADSLPERHANRLANRADRQWVIQSSMPAMRMLGTASPAARQSTMYIAHSR